MVSAYREESRRQKLIVKKTKIAKLIERFKCGLNSNDMQRQSVRLDEVAGGIDTESAPSSATGSRTDCPMNCNRPGACCALAIEVGGDNPRTGQRGQTAELAVDISGFSTDEARTRTGCGYGLDMVTDKLRPRSVHRLDTDIYADGSQT
jgi:hypothetical protein